MNNDQVLRTTIEALQAAAEALTALVGDEQQAEVKEQAAPEAVPSEKVTCAKDGCNSPIIYKDGLCYQHHKQAHGGEKTSRPETKPTPEFVSTSPVALLKALKTAKVGDVIHVNGSKRTIHANISAFKTKGGATWDSNAWVNRVNDTYTVGKKVFRFDNRLVWEGHRSFTRIK